MNKTKNVCIAVLFGTSVFANANTEAPATLAITKNDVTSVYVDNGNNQIYIMRKLYDEKGNVFVVGGFRGIARFGDTLVSAKGEMDFYLAKFTHYGARIWCAISGTANSEIGYDIVVDHYGNVVVAGTFELACPFPKAVLSAKGGYDGFVAKYDDNGHNLWAKVIAGGAGDDEAYSLASNDSGHVYVAGSFSQTAVLGTNTLCTSNGQRDLFLAKLTSDGGVVWVRMYGTAVDEHVVRIACGACHGDNNAVCIVWEESPVNKKKWYIWYGNTGMLLSKKPNLLTQ
ncbi:MAG: hypothetical protein MUD00_00285 [Candidatus Pacebacteria bacterium]|nr:hypothetical protein [Candidatus Paceibacterota bacterium]